jgi:hypothetical protein
MSVVTKEDLWDVRDTLSAEAMRGFGGVHERLDVLNGRVGRGEVQAGEHGVRLVNLEREVFKRRRTDAGDVTPEDRDAAPITRRDLKVAGYVLTGAAGTIGFLVKVLPWMLKAIVP